MCACDLLGTEEVATAATLQWPKCICVARSHTCSAPLPLTHSCTATSTTAATAQDATVSNTVFAPLDSVSRLAASYLLGLGP